MSTFPGYTSSKVFILWFNRPNTPIWNFCAKIWAAFTLLSTFLTVYGIHKILKTLKEIKKHNQRVD